MNILRTWGGLISSLLLSSLLWVMPAAAQSQHFEVKLAVRQTPVNLDSLGRDYTLSGGMQLGAGQPVVHAEVYAWQGALSPVEVTDLEYTPVDFEVARYPEWLSLPCHGKRCRRSRGTSFKGANPRLSIQRRGTLPA